jgi:dihydroorotate dehydrogenase (NAD+) catalytic subunit
LTDNRTVTPDLAIDIGRIHLKNPVIACSGTVASGLEYNKFYNISSLGAITTKSFSIRKKPGNPPPRIWETPSGMLNSIGLQNEGIDFFIKSELPEIKETGAEIILSIFGEDAEEFLKIAKKVIKIKDDIMAIELNFSCPNVDAGGMAFCAFPEQIRTITAGVKEITGIPLIVKLSPNYQTITESAEAAKKGGAEAVSIINTLVGTAFDIDTFKPMLGNIMGGLSGPAIKPVAVAMVYELANEKILPVIGMGGIFNWKDAVEFIIAGASAVGIGTANFVEVDAGFNIISGIANYMAEKNFKKVEDIIGKVLK